MAKKVKPSLLPKVEILIILVFFLSFITWAVSQCNAKKLFYEAKEIIDTPDPLASTSDSITNVVTPQNTTSTANNTNVNATTTTSPQTTIISEQYTPLYVSITGLNLRTGPHLDSSIIMKLELFEELVFLNEVTDSTQIINMGEEFANEPWVKVRQQKGHVGWVYGAGVNFYKRQRSGFQ